MGKTIAEWKKLIKTIDTRTLLESENGLVSCLRLLGVLGFKQEFGWTGIGVLKTLMKEELTDRGLENGTLITKINPHSELGRGDIKLQGTKGKAVKVDKM